MAFGSQTSIVLILAAAAPALAQQEFRYEVRHASPLQKMRFKTVRGALRLDSNGVSFEEVVKKKKKKPAAWSWPYREIQQLSVSPRSLTVLTYQDSGWKLGADREYRFDQPSEGGFEPVYQFLKSRLDERFVAAVALEEEKPEWELPAKHLIGYAGGSQGVLRFRGDGIVYSTSRREDSRIWRLSDIENISSSGPFQLTITTFERSKSLYNGYKDFNFQLKQRLEQDRFQKLWLALNKGRELNVLSEYRKESEK
ncbi:MAG: hypothetical protein HY235_14360 [Acidobacteria bacterium]|nr:hypothetical protein [Acidobacteriota bacterium]